MLLLPVELSAGASMSCMHDAHPGLTRGHGVSPPPQLCAAEHFGSGILGSDFQPQIFIALIPKPGVGLGTC